MDLEVARNFLIAIAIGALVGVERELKMRREGGDSFGGIRTYTMLALLGATAAWLTTALGMTAVLPVVLGLVGVSVVASYVLHARSDAQALGLNAELAALAVFLLAAMAVLGQPELAAALGVTVLALLAFKQRLHGAIAKLERDDVLAGTKLLIASFIVLPLLPDRTLDPWDALNPYKLWLLVVLVSALSLVGYLAMRWLGTAYGTALTAVAGGLVSSTATTLSLARTSRDHDQPAAAHGLAGGVLLAWVVMFARMAVLVGVVNLPLLRVLWPAVLAMGLVCAACAAWQYRAGRQDRANGGDGELPIANPFSLGSAIKFGLLFAVVLLVVALAQEYGPRGSVYLVAALSGTVDVDAITLSLARGVSADQASQPALAIVIAAISNTVVKCGMVIAVGGKAIRTPVIIATAAIAAAGVATAMLTV